VNIVGIIELSVGSAIVAFQFRKLWGCKGNSGERYW
jgi:hypothetical protein